MSANPWHRRYHSDALAGMLSLTLEERGAYQTVLDLIYDRGGPIADNERLLAGYMNCSVRKWRALRSALLRRANWSPGKAFCQIPAPKNSSKTTRKPRENSLKTARKVDERKLKTLKTRMKTMKMP